MKKLIYIILMGLVSFPAFVIGNEGDSLQQKRSGFVILPVIFYMPETKLAGGVSVNFYFREPGSAASSRPSTIMPSITYTQRKQIMSEVVADIYWNDEAYHFMGYIGYKKFPDKFYGIGNDAPASNEENYTPRSAIIRLNLQKKLRSGLNVGIRYEFEHHKLIEVKPGGILAGADIVGSKGGKIAGTGLLVNRDTRDNIFYPTSGCYCQISASMSNRAVGSDYEFKRYNFDFREYLSLSASGVIAFHTYMNIINGTPPFQKMSPLGGRIGGYNLMRGYYEGRYRDKDMIVFQLEYRIMPLWWRFGLVGFAGLGDVSDKIGNFELRNFKYAVGGGMRFLLNCDEKLNLRLDIGYGKGSSGIYMTIGEAF